MTTITFPESFEKRPHRVITNGLQWLYRVPDNCINTNIPAGQTIISIIGGSDLFYSNGIDTYEMWDYREDQPQGYLSKEDINKHLKLHPID